MTLAEFNAIKEEIKEIVTAQNVDDLVSVIKILEKHLTEKEKF